jgi:hypothetical protein
MKVTINLTASELKGIKAYLMETEGNQSKEAIQRFIQGVVECTIHSSGEAVNNYINEFENK